MNEMLETLVKVWPLIVTFVTCVAWLIRLESKYLYLEQKYEARFENHERELMEHKEHYNETKNKIWDKLDIVQDTVSLILQKLSHIEGYMGIKKK